MTKQIQHLKHCVCVRVCVCRGSTFFCLDPNPKGDISLVEAQPRHSPHSLCVCLCCRHPGSARKSRQAVPWPLTHDCLLALGSCATLMQTADRRTDKHICAYPPRKHEQLRCSMMTQAASLPDACKELMLFKQKLFILIWFSSACVHMFSYRKYLTPVKNNVFLAFTSRLSEIEEYYLTIFTICQIFLTSCPPLYLLVSLQMLSVKSHHEDEKQSFRH